METSKNKLPQVITIIVLAVAAAIVIVTGTLQNSRLNKQNHALNRMIVTRDSLVDEMTTTFDEIENSLTFVKNKRGELLVAPKEGAGNKKEALIADIKLMDDLLTESSKKIEELEKKLEASGMEIKSFRNKIAQLNRKISEQNENIRLLTAELEKRDFRINEMDQMITTMNNDLISKEDTILMKSQVIADQVKVITQKDDEMNKAYFITGSQRELKDKGIIRREGGFLGLGRSSDVEGDVSEQNFSRLDQRKVLTLPINSKKAEVISEHPADSYHLIYENDQIAFLQIEDPAEFWKLTKYLVVETR